MRVRNESVGDLGSVLRTMENQVQDTIRKTSLSKDVDDCVVTTGRKFGTFEDAGVAGSQCVRDGANTEGVRGIPMMVVSPPV
jgi:hypothetical protein